ncbi:MAG: hypothetical protein ACYC1D_13245 [Acidimicrobiales bacterium]
MASTLDLRLVLRGFFTESPEQSSSRSRRRARHDHSRFARSIDHGRVAEVCTWISASPGAGRQHIQAIVTELQANPDIKRFAAIFLRLQQARHEADYDHLADFSKATTLTHLQQARTALDLIDSLMGTPDGERLLALIALHVQLR